MSKIPIFLPYPRWLVYLSKLWTANLLRTYHSVPVSLLVGFLICSSIACIEMEVRSESCIVNRYWTYHFFVRAEIVIRNENRQLFIQRTGFFLFTVFGFLKRNFLNVFVVVWRMNVAFEIDESRLYSSRLDWIIFCTLCKNIFRWSGSIFVSRCSKSCQNRTDVCTKMVKCF